MLLILNVCEIAAVCYWLLVSTAVHIGWVFKTESGFLHHQLPGTFCDLLELQWD